MQISFNVLNLFDQAASVSAFQTENGSGDGISFNEADFYAGQLNFAALKAAQGVSTDPRIRQHEGRSSSDVQLVR